MLLWYAPLGSEQRVEREVELALRLDIVEVTVCYLVTLEFERI